LTRIADYALGRGQIMFGQIGFHEQSEVRPPVVEKGDEGGQIDRDELMHRARRQAFFRERRRSHGAGGGEHVEAAGADALDQRHHGDEFADTRAMDPDQRPGQPRRARFAAPFADAGFVLLAVPQPVVEQTRRKRSRGRRRPAVGRKGQRHLLSPDRHDDPCGRRSRRRGR
jgi:hypothetical protein